MNPQRWIFVASVAAAIAVAGGAFAAHALPHVLERQGVQPAQVQRRLANLETAVRYAMYHALALLALASVSRQLASGGALAAASLFLVGLVLFCGLLAAHALIGSHPLTWLIPIGGIAFIAGWLVAAAAALIGRA